MKHFSILLLFVGILAKSDPSSRPDFQKIDIQVGNKKVRVELANTDAKRSYGLMHIEKLPPDQGMLFVFERPKHQSFWMKNTRVALSIAYFDHQKKIISIQDMEPESLVAREFKTYPSNGEALYALEMNKGWFERNKIKKGAILKLPKDFSGPK